MKRYSSAHTSPTKLPEVKRDCGTAACAIGHAPLVKGATKPKEDEMWHEYSRRFTFGIMSGYFSLLEQEYVWEFLYDSMWAEYDNTPHGAGKRILFLLESTKNINNVIKIREQFGDPYTSTKLWLKLYENFEVKQGELA